MSGPGWRWRRIIRPDAKSEVDEELQFHYEQRVRDYVARGMSEPDARTAAEQRLGDLTRIRSECTSMLSADNRNEQRREWLKVSWLDFKLGFRMLVKYPGLTIVGGLAMAFAIWAGAGGFELVRQTVAPVLPLPDGDRIVGIEVVDAQTSGRERKLLYDFALWREQLAAVEDLGAFRTLELNLVIPGAGSGPVDVAEMSASGFRVAGVRPLLGRALQPADERADAPAVVVIGHDLWRRRFGADSDVVGRSVQIGGTSATVVGVMPEGFAFPVAQSVWVPFRFTDVGQIPRAGASIRVFGRLAGNVSIEQAQTELTTLSQRIAAQHPDTHEHLRSRVLPYARSIINLTLAESLAMLSVNLFLLLLVVLICANVALLMFARAATRENELVVRSALGASRGRIVAQLFAEALVLGGIAALIGLAAANWGMRWMYGAMETIAFVGTQAPFWFRPAISPVTTLYVVALTMLGAAVAGVLPALKVTRGLQARLREATTGLGFGGVWTFVIVTQVAVTFVFPVATFMTRREAMQIRTEDVGFPEREYLSARFEVDLDPRDGTTPLSAASTEQAAAERSARIDELYSELEERLDPEPAVAAVTFGNRLPRMYHPHRLIDIDEGGGAPLHPQWPAYRVSSAHIDTDFFDVLQVPLVAGRAFTVADVAAAQHVVIVNESFVERVLGGRNAIGRHIRYRLFEGRRYLTEEELAAEPWYEIVGVVPDLTTVYGDFDPKSSAIYHPAAPHQAYPLSVAIRVHGEPGAFGPRLRALAADIDPAIRIYDPVRMDELSQAELEFIGFWISLATIVSALAILLSLAGIYAVMSFTVSRRTREIGIRVALGSDPRRVAAAIFRRPALQITLGILFGAAVVIALAYSGFGTITPKQAAFLTAYTLAMLGVCGLACVVPTRRALRVQPMDAMRADA